MSLSDEFRSLNPETLLASYASTLDAIAANPTEDSPVLDAIGDYPALYGAMFGLEELFAEKSDYPEAERTLVFHGIVLAFTGLARYAHEEVLRQHVKDISTDTTPPQD
jgi:hypothetical protein